jgi:hypothetical protein
MPHAATACCSRPVRYAIVAGATAAAKVRMTRVDCCKQACIATLVTAVPAVAGEASTATSGAVAGKAPTAANGPPAMVESAAIPPMRDPRLGRNHASIIAWQRGGGGSGSLAAARRQQLGDSAASAVVVAAAAAAWRRQQQQQQRWRWPAW